jgi:hypothetical protein
VLFYISLLMTFCRVMAVVEVVLVSMMQFLITTPVTSPAKMLGLLLPVVVILKPLQSSVMLSAPARISSALKSHTISESRVVLDVNAVPQAGVTASVLVEFSNIRTPANNTAFRLIKLNASALSYCSTAQDRLVLKA